MKKLIYSIIALVMFLPAVICLSACGKKDNGTKIDARQIYALSAVSGISYLQGNGAGGLGALNTPTRPELFTQTDVDAIKNSMSLFDTVIDNGGVNYTLKENTSQDPELINYNLQMDIKLVGITQNVFCTMYFDEINSSTHEEIDDGKKEIEFNTTFSGVVVYGEEKFQVSGRTEVEKEDNDVETEIEFKVKKTESDYVIIEQSVEDNEIEYEYKIFEGGSLVQDFEIEYEQGRHGAEVEFELKNISSSSTQRTTFRIKKATANNTFMMTFRKNGTSQNVTIEKLAENEYKLTYANDYIETV